MRLAAGTRFGPYEIVSPLGAGGMGEVYRARDTRLGRDVAIKVLHPQTSSDPKALARFEQEARVVAALSHPNLVAIHDVGNVDGTMFAVMELLEGSTLRDRLAAAEIGIVRAVEWALQIAQGLSAAHERGIVHRDLKPENVFITQDGNVKILDFGLARRSSLERERGAPPEPSLTGAGMVLGTVGYLSPEQARGSPPITVRTFSRSGSSSTRSSQAGAPSIAKRLRRRCLRCCVTSRRRLRTAAARCRARWRKSFAIAWRRNRWSGSGRSATSCSRYDLPSA